MLASSFMVSMVSSQTAITTTGKQQVAYLMAEDSPDARLSVVSQSGVYRVIYQYPDDIVSNTYPDDVVVDSAGHLIVAECGNDMLTQITLPSTRTVIYSFPGGSCPVSVVIDSAGNYIVALATAHELVKVTPTGVESVIHTFSLSGTDCGPVGWGNPETIVIDPSGNYIVTECALDRLSMVTPAGVYSVIYNFSKGTTPSGVAIDSSGNYIVGECGTQTISKITPSGERTVLYKYPSGTPSCGAPDYHGDLFIAIDPSGNYIVAEYLASTLAMITPGGVRTPIYTIPETPFFTIPYPVSVQVVNASLFQTATLTTSTSTSSFTGTPSTTVTTSPTTATSTIKQTTTVSSVSTSSSTSSSTATSPGIPEFPYTLVSVAVLTAITAVAYLVVHHRRSPP